MVRTGACIHPYHFFYNSFVVPGPPSWSVSEQDSIQIDHCCSCRHLSCHCCFCYGCCCSELRNDAHLYHVTLHSLPLHDWNGPFYHPWLHRYGMYYYRQTANFPNYYYDFRLSNSYLEPYQPHRTFHPRYGDLLRQGHRILKNIIYPSF